MFCKWSLIYTSLQTGLVFRLGNWSHLLSGRNLTFGSGPCRGDEGSLGFQVDVVMSESDLSGIGGAVC